MPCNRSVVDWETELITAPEVQKALSYSQHTRATREKDEVEYYLDMTADAHAEVGELLIALQHLIWGNTEHLCDSGSSKSGGM